MTIADIYDKYTIPPNLRRHMLLVTSVAKFVCKNWKGPKLKEHDIEVACLLHDVGNIVKFDLDNYPHFLGPSEQNRIDYWRLVKQKMVDTYGKDDYDATHAILTETGIDPYIIRLVETMSPINSVSVAQGSDWNLKVMMYADLRVGPMGILSLKERLDDIFNRLEKYKGKTDVYDAALLLNSQIEEYVSGDLTKIPECKETDLLSTTIDSL